MFRSTLLLTCAALCVCLIPESLPAQADPPAMVSRFADDLDPENPLPEYPRPQLVRDRWVNLNGRWDYAIRPREEARPSAWDGKIVVPFCIESQLSGVQKRVGETNQLWYRSEFTLPEDYASDRILLHFGGVDWRTTVFVNGTQIGSHEGCYDPFTFDITDAVKKPGEKNELVLSVWDPTDTMTQPRGKQVSRPRGIWYTPVTGIWQTVWIEPVPADHIAGLVVTPDVDTSTLKVRVQAGGSATPAQSVRLRLLDGQNLVAEATGQAGSEIGLKVGEPKLWSPDAPFLYNLSVELRGADGAADTVTSYAAMRKIHFQKDESGFNRMYLNNEPLFQFGPLDQGFWPDGIYTAPTDAALRYDIEVTKQLGFNMARKHIKVEPLRWYYWCDKLGLLVWQDMPSGFIEGSGQALNRGQPDVEYTEEQAGIFKHELQAMIDHLRSIPAIVVWVPFNEGWGQHNTNDILKWVKEYDPTRLVAGPSGWEDRGYGDLLDMHQYPGPGMFPPVDHRVSVLGEFGGLGLPLEGHTWLNKDNWGYRTYSTSEELHRQYDRLIEQLPPLIADGLAAAVYTQTTDVEVEVNGLMTYDRRVIKFQPDHLSSIHQVVYAPPGKRTVLLPAAGQQPQDWQYTTEPPAEDWQKSNFSAQGWKTGLGGFGTKETYNATVNTIWKTSDIWIRKEFEVETVPESGTLLLKIHHDDDVEVYLNGELILNKQGFERGYLSIPIDQSLQTGKNVIAAHCRQHRGGQYLDIGLETFEAGR